MKHEIWKPLREDGALDAEALAAPLGWTEPRRVEVACDLFGPGADDCTAAGTACQIAAVFGVMAACPQHTFWLSTSDAGAAAAWDRWVTGPNVHSPAVACYLAAVFFMAGYGAERASVEAMHTAKASRWPLPNVRLGLQASTQVELDDGLREGPTFGWLDLSPVTAMRLCLGRWTCPTCREWFSSNSATAPSPNFCTTCLLDGPREDGALNTVELTYKLDFSLVRVRGEAWTDARPLHPQWARDIRDACQAAGVPFVFDGWGDWVPSHAAPPEVNGCSKRRRAWEIAGAVGPRPNPEGVEETWWRGRSFLHWGIVDLDGCLHFATTPWNGADDVVRDGLHEALVYRVGADRSGREIDGATHDWPEAIR